MVTIEIMWNDLTAAAQQEIREMLHMRPNDCGNWDVFPLAVLEFEENELDEDDAG